MDWTVKFLK